MKDHAERFVLNELWAALNFKLHETLKHDNIIHDCNSKVLGSSTYVLRHTLLSQL